MAVNLCAAHKKTESRAAHKVLLACFLQSCSTRRWISCSTPRWISCSAQNIARMLYTKVNSCVTREFRLSHSTKIEHTRVPTHECQLRHELYCTALVGMQLVNVFNQFSWCAITNWLRDCWNLQLCTGLIKKV